ncbi:MAG TPA: CBS and ACT domain-containing protein [Rubrobacteraceae bacterium]|nr:CBS and ACT domain-containing protein [Rubrobacteraceae bacterium]
MLRVRDSMTREVITLGPEASAAEAWSLCQEHKIRHLPIVEEGRLVGLVSDRDLRDVRGGGEDKETDSPRWVRVGEIMTRQIVTIHPLDTIDHAAREIYDRKIGSLPVVADGELVGIITSADMMRTLIELVGAHGVGTWVEVEVPNEPGQLANLTDVVRDRKVNIGSVFLGPASRETNRVIVLRLETTNPSGIVETLKDAGYNVTTVESSVAASVQSPYEE